MWWAGQGSKQEHRAGQVLLPVPRGHSRGQGARARDSAARRSRQYSGAGTMKIERRFTTAEDGAYGGISFATTTSEIRNPDGTVVFRNDNVEVPEGWSQVASDVIAQKYFRKAGV